MVRTYTESLSTPLPSDSGYCCSGLGGYLLSQP